MTPTLPMPAGSFWSRLVRGRRVVHATPDWDAVAGAGWADRVMGEAVGDRFHAKQGRSVARWDQARDGRRLVAYLKRHHELPRWRGLLAAAFPGRAWSPGLEEWEHLRWAAAAGLPVPRAVAVGQLLGPWGRLRGFLAVEELAGMLPLHEAIPLAHRRLSPAAFARWKRGLVAELARLSRHLHDRSAFHQDLYLCHFYVPEVDCGRVPEAWPGRVWMIDFHRLTRRRVGAAWWRVKDLAQLLFSTAGVDGITARDRLRFGKHYRGGSWLRAAVAWKAGRYQRHNDRRARG